MKNLILAIAILFSIYLFGANKDNDPASIDDILSLPNDTNKISALLIIAEKLYMQDPDSCVKLANLTLDISEKIQFDAGISQSYGWLGYLYNKKGLVEQAIENYNKCLLIYERDNFKPGLAIMLTNLGILYKKNKDYDRALELYQRCLKLDEELKNIEGYTVTLNNIGKIYAEQKKYEQAVDYFEKCITLNDQVDYKEGIASAYKNLGMVYLAVKDTQNAMIKFIDADKLYHQIKDKEGMASVAINLGYLYLGRKKYPSVLELGYKSFDFGNQMGYPERIRDASLLLYNTYKILHNTDSALRYHEIYMVMKDSVSNNEIKKATIRQQANYDFEKEQILKERELAKAMEAEERKRERRDNMQYIIILMVLILVFGLVLSFGFIKVSPKLAEGLIFFAFLILFEFLLVLTDPYVDGIAKGAPGIKLLLNAGLAAMIFPAHAFFEKTLKLKLIKNNSTKRSRSK